MRKANNQLEPITRQATPNKYSPYPKARSPEDWVRRLIEIVRALKLNENPKIADLVEKIALTGNQKAARKMVKRFADAYYKQLLNPDNFISLADNLEGEFLIGYTEDGRPFGLDRPELNCHCGIFSQSGFGKSTIIKNLLMQGKGKIHQVSIDRKGDLEFAVREGIDNIHWSKKRRNVLCPSDSQVSIQEYRNIFAVIFSEIMQFMERGKSIFLFGLDYLYKEFDVYKRWPVWDWESMTFPTLIDLLELFKRNEFAKHIKGHGRESRFSIIDKLESLIIELEPIVSCQKGFSIDRFYKEKRTINYVYEGISQVHQNFLILADILEYYLYFKTHGPRNQLNAIFYFDEAKSLFGNSNKNMYIVKELISIIREFGVSLIASDQIPSEISQAFFSNIGTLIWLRTSDGFDLNRLRMSSGASFQQTLENYSLKPGEAIVRSMKCKDLLRIRVPFEPVEKYIPRDEVDRLMRTRLEELNKDVIPYVKKEEKSEKHSKEKPEILLDENEIEMLRCLAKNFVRPVSDIYQELGISKSAGFRLKERLRRRGLVSQVTTNLGKDGKQAKLLIPNPIVFEQLEIPLEEDGRGLALHTHCQSKHKIQAEERGFEAIIEESLNGTPEAPDVGITKNGIKTAIEICITSKPSTEVRNIEKNFRLGFQKVILSFVNSHVLQKTQDLAKEKYSKEELEKVRFCLINQVALLMDGD